MNKWIGISLGTVVGLTHIGMIGLLISRNEFPQLNLPITDYTSYSVEAGKEGYKINYRANDPLVMGVRKDIKKPAGFLGLGEARMHSEEQYTMDGARHLGGGEDSPKLSAAQVACIEAAGGGKQTGRIVGGSIGATVASSGLASIPYVGWVLAGAATLFGMEQGAEIGGQMATEFADCDPDLQDDIKEIE